MSTRNLLNKFTGVSLGAALAAVLALHGCAVTPPDANPNRAQALAINLNQRAGKAFEQGDYPRAKAYYEQALSLDASIENADGVAINAISLARVHQALGQMPTAHRYLDRVLEDQPLKPSRNRQAEAATRKGQLYLAVDDLLKAEQWFTRAQELCTQCPALPAILNLRARVALARSDNDAAVSWASQALSASGSDDARIERANANRVLGEARIARGEFVAAANNLRQALELDQALGLAGRIYLDLMQLGKAYARQGQRGQAKEFFGRALEVAGASENREGARAAQLEIDRLASQ